jgi:hypothetical protein
MSNLLQKHQAWQIRREQRSLERWHRLRAQGKPRFVIETAAAFGLTMVGLTDVVDYLSVGSHSMSLSKLFIYLIGGFIAGLIGWSSMENKYKKALNKTHTATPDPRLRITP